MIRHLRAQRRRPVHCRFLATLEQPRRSPKRRTVTTTNRKSNLTAAHFRSTSRLRKVRPTSSWRRPSRSCVPPPSVEENVEGSSAPRPCCWGSTTTRSSPVPARTSSRAPAPACPWTGSTPFTWALRTARVQVLQVRDSETKPELHVSDLLIKWWLGHSDPLRTAPAATHGSGMWKIQMC